LVAKGYSQIPVIDFNDVFSPVVKHSTIHTLLSIVAMHDYELEQLDVRTALLHGKLEEDIYMNQPKGFVIPEKENLVCKLKKSFYDFKRPDYNSCVYLKIVNGSTIYLLLYIDDMLIAAKEKSEIAN
jgi:hypothetical protein